MGILIDIALNLVYLGLYGYFNNTNPSNSCTQDIYIFI